MFQSNKPVSLFIIFLWLLLLLAACQPKAIIRHDDEPVIVSNVTEIPLVSVIEVTLTPENLRVSTIASTAVATLTATPLPTETIPTATLMPIMVPTHSPFYGWLLFSSRRQDTNEDGVLDENDGVHIYAIEVSTRQLTQLTAGNQRDLRPAWSPDRSQIVFVSNREGNYELYIMNADGSEVRRLTNTLEDETMPRWSPNGTKIIYVVVKTLDSGLQEKRLYLISASGDNMQQLTNGSTNDDAPDWSPDGRYLTFTREEDFIEANGATFHGKVVYLMDMQTKQTFRLTLTAKESGHGQLENPRWLPRNGYFLSMTQVPGDLSSVGIKVFEIEWKDGQPMLYRVFAIADVGGRYVWGPNGEWLILTEPNDVLNDLILLPVNLSTQPRVGVASNPAVPSSYNYSTNQGEFITNDSFYDDYPDWAP